MRRSSRRPSSCLTGHQARMPPSLCVRGRWRCKYDVTHMLKKMLGACFNISSSRKGQRSRLAPDCRRGLRKAQPQSGRGHGRVQSQGSLPRQSQWYFYEEEKKHSIILLCFTESQPTALWVWDLANLQQIALLVTREPIRSVKWTPVSAGGDKDPSEEDAQFAFCTGTSWVYLWQVSCISCYQVPISNFTVQTLQWQPTGQALLLCDKDRFCVGFF